MSNRFIFIPVSQDTLCFARCFINEESWKDDSPQHVFLLRLCIDGAWLAAMWDDLEQRRKGERLRRKRNIGSPRRGTFSRLGLKNRVNLRTRPRARYKETRICMRFFRNLPHEDENSFNTGTSVESFCAIYDGPPALYINYNPLLITWGTKFYV